MIVAPLFARVWGQPGFKGNELEEPGFFAGRVWLAPGAAWVNITPHGVSATRAKEENSAQISAERAGPRRRSKAVTSSSRPR